MPPAEKGERKMGLTDEDVVVGGCFAVEIQLTV